LALTVAEHRPVLLILDPFVRLHRVDENVAGDVAPILDVIPNLVQSPLVGSSSLRSIDLIRFLQRVRSRII
jgi:hypothetical protein